MKTIAIDLDGTAYQYHTAYCYMANNYLGARLDPDKWTDWDYPSRHLNQGQLDWMRTFAVKRGLYRYGHVMKGAIIAINKLAERFELIVVTHRPRNAVRDTLAWLTYVDLPWSGIHILSDRQPKSSVDWDILIDDKPENIEDAIGHCRGGVLFDQAWNKDAMYKWPARANWHNIEEAFVERTRVRPE